MKNISHLCANTRITELVIALDRSIIAMSRSLMRGRIELREDLAQEIRAAITPQTCRRAVERARRSGTTPQHELMFILRDHGRQSAAQLRGTGMVHDGTSRDTERLRRRLQRIEARAAQEKRELSDTDACEVLGVGPSALLTLRCPVQLVRDTTDEIACAGDLEAVCDRRRALRDAQVLLHRGTRRAAQQARCLVGPDMCEVLKLVKL